MIQDVNIGSFGGAHAEAGILPWKTQTLINEGCILDYEFSKEPGIDNFQYNLPDLTGTGNTGRMGNNSNPYFPNVFGCRRVQSNNAIEVPPDLKGLEHNIHWDLNWSFEIWLKCSTFTTMPQQYKNLYGSYNGSNPILFGAAGIHLWPFSGSGSIRIGLTPPVGPDVGINFFVTGQSWIIPEMENKWCHFVFTSEDGQYYSCFLNGEKKFRTFFDFKNHPTRVKRTSNTRYFFGGDGTTHYLDALFARCRFFNRPLTEAEVLHNYLAYKTRFNHDN